MDERDSIGPVALGLIAAVAVHVAFFASLSFLQAHNLSRRAFAQLYADSLATEAPHDESELQLGRDKAVVTTSVAWIPYDDVRELLARQEVTEQPAVQMVADPVDQAPLLIDATNPTPQPQPQQSSSAVAVELTVPAAPPPPIPGRQAPELPPLDPMDTGELAIAHPAPQEQTGDVPSPVVAPLMPQASAEQTLPLEKPPAQPAPSSAASQPVQAESRPTAAARTDREAPPTAIVLRLYGDRRGRVEVMEGLEVLTIAPRVSVISILTSEPGDAVFGITFDQQGRVTNAKMLRSSRYLDIDAAIEAAVYKWRAEGEKLKSAPHTIQVTFRG